MEHLTSEELFSVTEELYKIKNPTSRFSEPPSHIYALVIEKWYPEYRQSNSELTFKEWCLTEKAEK